MSERSTKVKTDIWEQLGDSNSPASEATLQALLIASGGSVYNFVQSTTDATYKYFGFASTTGWQFKRKTLSTGVWQISSGSGDYDTNWALRDTKTYTYI